jgi:amidohydrolase
MAQEVPCGIVIVAPGPILAAPDGFTITIQGKGGHAAAPHRSIDPVVAGSMLVMALQTVVSRSVDPIESAVVTVGKFGAGEAFNVIPDTAVLGGTVRSFDPSVRDLAQQRITEICAGIAATTWHHGRSSVRPRVSRDRQRRPGSRGDPRGGARSRRAGAPDFACHRSWPVRISRTSSSSDPERCSGGNPE